IINLGGWFHHTVHCLLIFRGLWTPKGGIFQKDSPFGAKFFRSTVRMLFPILDIPARTTPVRRVDQLPDVSRGVDDLVSRRVSVIESHPLGVIAALIPLLCYWDGESWALLPSHEFLSVSRRL